MPGSTTSIPDVIDALAAKVAATAEFSKPGTLIFDGVVDDPTALRQLLIGSQANAESAVGTQSPSFGGQRRAEEYDLDCFVYSWNGDTDQKAVRDDAKALLAAVDAVLRADGSLGGVVNMAWLGGIAYEATPPEQAADGRSAKFVFTVHVRTLVNVS